jgi:hypothetical protein
VINAIPEVVDEVRSGSWRLAVLDGRSKVAALDFRLWRKAESARSFSMNGS